jgi:hypothetical protein
MRTLLVLSLLGLSAGATPCLAEERKVLTPEQVEKDRPQGEVTISFRVEGFGLLDGVIPVGQPPHLPISVEATANLKDRRNKLYVVLVGKALTQVHRLGIDDPGKHFGGRTIEATGKVRYITLPQITRDGKVEIPADSYTHYEMVIDSLDNFCVVR